MTTRIKQILKEHNISQSEVATRMGISRQSLYERLSSQEISISTLSGIAEAINISLAELCAQLEAKPLHIPSDELSLLRQENTLLRQMIKEKDALIAQLMQFQQDLQEIKTTLNKR